MQDISTGKFFATGIIRSWMHSKGWKPARFQEECMDAVIAGMNGLLNAPTGSGKTYALFSAFIARHVLTHPDYRSRRDIGLRLLWITPLRALTKDIHRAMETACAEMNLPWRIGVRSGDLSSQQKSAQSRKMPEVLLITPESLHLLFSNKGNSTLFKKLDMIVVDEWHELLGSKRGVQTELTLSRLKSLRPGVLTWGISATIGNLDEALVALTGTESSSKSVIVTSDKKKKTEVVSILPENIKRLPWAGFLGIALLDKVMEIVTQSRTTLLFTNTRSQTEIWYRHIMDRYPELAGLVALHHGSLDREIRTWVEDALHREKLKLVICTSSLDLGVDFQPVETVIQVGSPKSISRFLQRAGRSGHRPGETSRIYFVPTHALELIEAVSLREGVRENIIEARQPVVQAFDVLVQYMVTLASGEGFEENSLFEEVKKVYAYRFLLHEEWNRLLNFVTTGGDTLLAYDEYKKVVVENGVYRVTDRRIAMRHRLSMGTIVSDASLKVKYMTGRYLGSIEENFITRLKPGETFWFAGVNLEIIRVRDMTVTVKKAPSGKGVVPRWMGGRISLSSELSVFIRKRLDEYVTGEGITEEMKTLSPILDLQSERSSIPGRNQFLVERLKSREGFHYFFFPFEGRLVHEGLSALFAYRISNRYPATFSLAMNDYGFELLSDREIPLGKILEESWLMSQDGLLDDIESSVNATEMARRKFREIAAIAGLIFPGFPGKRLKTRQIQSSSALFFDVISEHEPKNLLIRQAYQEVLDQQLEEQRLRKTLSRIRTQEIIYRETISPTPFAFPILVDRLREQLTSEKLEERVKRMLAQYREYGNQDQG